MRRTVRLRQFFGVPVDGVHVPLALPRWSALHVHMVQKKSVETSEEKIGRVWECKKVGSLKKSGRIGEVRKETRSPRMQTS